MEQKFIAWFKDLGIQDVPKVGGKNAALGEMYSHLTSLGINVPNGFAITADAYRYFLEKAGLKDKIHGALEGLNTKNLKDLQKRGKKVRQLILDAKLPKELEAAVREAYGELGKLYYKNPDVAVRSSATAEDLPGSSFAGQQETYLNVQGANDVLLSTKKCIASLFTDRAISYRVDKGFSHFDVALSVGIQKMVRSDLACSGVMFTLDTETGFRDVVMINGSYGLGEMVVQGAVTPDEFVVFKPTLKQGKKAIIGKELGLKNVKLIDSPTGTKKVAVDPKDQAKFCLTDAEVLKLAGWGVKLEEYFSKRNNTDEPMDTEWAKDGRSGELFIVQARPETIHASEDRSVVKEYRLQKSGTAIVSGAAVGTKIGAGKVRVIKDVKMIGQFKKGEVLVTEITDPDWEPIMKIASAIVTDKGGRTSHAAIVSRELGIPCVVGTTTATKELKNGMDVTVDCSSGETGKVLKGKLPFEVLEHHLDKLPQTRTNIFVNIGSPDEAFKNHYLPVQGVGLGRLEFIIASHIQIHPNALIEFDKLKKSKDPKAREAVKKIEAVAGGYKDKKEYYVERLAQGIARIGAAFYPNHVIIRFSDFKTNEYRKLTGGELYEPSEENPMIGWRGASRYYDPKFKAAFALEVAAMRRVREEMGLTNVIPMIPFCRTVKEGQEVVAVMAEHGLDRAKDKDLKIYVMCEIPSNVILADEFLKVFDGFSIGSNDLTQLTLGLDRDSGIVTHIANEKNEAVKELVKIAIRKCNEKGKYIGICGQAPSDYPDFAQFLVEEGIQSISLNPDTVIRTLLAVAETEKKVHGHAVHEGRETESIA